MSDVGYEIPLVCDVPIAAQILDCSQGHVWNLIARGQIETIRLGRLVRIPRASLLRILEHGTDAA